MGHNHNLILALTMCVSRYCNNVHNEAMTMQSLGYANRSSNFFHNALLKLQEAKKS